MTNFAICGLNAVDERPDNRAMMGLQATTTALAGSPPPYQPHQASKRRLEAATAVGRAPPAKSARWDHAPAARPTRRDSSATPDDCIARLRAVAENAWATPPAVAATPPSGLTVPIGGRADGRTVLSDDEFEDDEFEDDELDDGGGREGRYGPVGGGANGGGGGLYGSSRYHQPPQADHYWSPQYYPPAPPQQTIRREANGKSYLELGPAPRPPPAQPPIRRCCARWCRPAPCYRQRRLAVLNLSVCKLARYRQCSDPSLRRSVLICNTLRRLEREMESEPADPPYPAPPAAPPTRQAPPTADFAYEQLRDLSNQSGRATPFPSAAADDGDSGVGTLDGADDDDDDGDRPINWGSVLSLSSSGCGDEPLNNNELYAELGLGGWKERDEWEGLVAVGGT